MTTAAQQRRWRARKAEQARLEAKAARLREIAGLSDSELVGKLATLAIAWTTTQTSAGSLGVALAAADVLDVSEVPEPDGQAKLRAFAERWGIEGAITVKDSAGRTAARELVYTAIAALEGDEATTAPLVRAGLRGAQRLLKERPRLNTRAVDLYFWTAMAGGPPPADLMTHDGQQEREVDEQ